MSSKFDEMLGKDKLQKIDADKDMIAKELEGSEYDLEKAKETFENEDYKWATIQAYYSIFHSVRALIYKKGYREKSHFALLIAFRELYVNEKLIDRKFSGYFDDAMGLRESADYDLTFSKESAEEIIRMAEEFIEEAGRMLK